MINLDCAYRQLKLQDNTREYRIAALMGENSHCGFSSNKLFQRLAHIRAVLAKR